MLEVDYDKNLTELYKAITDQDWEKAVSVCRQHPSQAATWVVRHYEEDEDDEGEQEIMWRFLPIHSACARQPPAEVVAALVHAYPDGPRCIDDQGMYALHYACGNQASRDVIRQLLVGCPEAAKIPDPRGMLPVHYLACWGPSSVSVMDMILVAHRDVASVRDEEGNAPLDLAQQGDYDNKDEVVDVLKRWIGDTSASLMDTASEPSFEASTKQSDSRSRATQKISHRSKKKESASIPVVKSTTLVTPRGRTSSISSALAHSPTIPGTSIPVVRAHAPGVVSRGLFEGNEEEEKKEEEISNPSAISRSLSFQDAKGTASFWKAKFDTFEKTIQHQAEELRKSKEELVKLKRSNGELSEQLRESNNERDGLRTTLGDLMEQHEEYKKRSVGVNDRLGSLSTCLKSMMEHQKYLETSLLERNKAFEASFKSRKERLRELIELEDVMQEDEGKLQQSLTKQSRELHAIAAVIEAARD